MLDDGMAVVIEGQGGKNLVEWDRHNQFYQNLAG